MSECSLRYSRRTSAEEVQVKKKLVFKERGRMEEERKGVSVRGNGSNGHGRNKAGTAAPAPRTFLICSLSGGHVVLHD